MSLDICTLASGSKGNCTLIKSEKTAVIIDSGLAAKEIILRMKNAGVSPEEIKGILVTHEHSDHIKGISSLSKKYSIPVFADERLWTALEGKTDVNPRLIKIFHGDDFFLDDLTVSPFMLPHDSAFCTGFSIYCGGRKISVATDLGFMPDRVMNKLEKSDLILLESNHDVEMLKTCRYPEMLKARILGSRGHLSNDTAAECILKLACKGTRQFILGHLSEESNTPRIAYATASDMLEINEVHINKDVYIDVAPQHTIGRYIKII